MDPEESKREAAVAAADLARDGMTIGLGTGSTVAHLLPALAARNLRGLRCVATSRRTEEDARALGLSVEPFDALERLDLAIDGADQIAPDGWLIKGGGGAHLREKVVAAAADRFVVISDDRKVVEALTPPVPLELLAYGLPSTLARLREIGEVTLRDAPPSPDGGVIADLRADVEHPGRLAALLSGTVGVADHGLFAPELTSDVIIAGGGTLEHRRRRG
jgi:ribose 5-phosphate isomerase A